MKISSKTLFLGWCMLPGLVSAQDSEATTVITPLGSSGKFRISDERVAADPDSVVVEADYVAEIIADGSTKSSTHQTPTMANQEFSISSPTDTTVGDGIPASLVTFSTTLTEKGGSSAAYGTMEFDTYIIEGSGTITSEDGSDNFDVQEDDIKFNIRLSDWTFDTNSEYVDVALIIKGRAEQAEEDESEEQKTFDLGGNVPLILSGRVVVDGVETDMPEGYPTYTQTGNKYTFIFRFPKFTDTAVYDPVVAYSQAGCFFSWLGFFTPALKLLGVEP